MSRFTLSSVAVPLPSSLEGSKMRASTSGGTSNARFLSKLCPTVEFGLLNATMHQVDEAVAIADLETLTTIYADIITRAA